VENQNKNRLAGMISDLWNGSVPRSLLWIVWYTVIVIFLIFAGRFAFIGASFHGLYQHDLFWVFWLISTIFFCISWFQWEKSGITYIILYPILLTIESLKLLPVGQISLHTLNILAIGWIVKGTIHRNIEIKSLQWGDLVIGCFAIVGGFSAFYSLLYPSWVNSLSVAFSAFDWNGEMNDFNALNMGYNFITGCILYIILRTTCIKIGFKAIYIALITQVILLILCWVVLQLVSFNPEFGKNKISPYFPFDSKHTIAMYSVMAFAVIFGRITFRKKKTTQLIGLAIICFALSIIVFFAGSKIAWVIIFMLFIFILTKKNKWNIIALLTLIIAFVFLFNKLEITKLIPDRINVEMRTLQPVNMTNNVTFTHRIGIYRNVIEIIKNYPFCGLGLGSSPAYISQYPVKGFLGGLNWDTYVNPDSPYLFYSTHNFYNCHNDFLEIIESMGIIGLLLFLIPLVFIFIITSNSSAIICIQKEMLYSGIAMCIISYVIFSSFNSMLTTSAGCIIFFEFLALCVCCTTDEKRSKPVPKLFLWPILLPICFFIGASWNLLYGGMPANRNYGIWNWHMRDEKNNFLLAKESQFVIPPFEKLDALAFSLPYDSQKTQAKILISVDGSKPTEVYIQKEREANLVLMKSSNPEKWTTVKVLCDSWCGRGAINSSLGVKPYSVSMRKIRPLTPTNY